MVGVGLWADSLNYAFATSHFRIYVSTHNSNCRRWAKKGFRWVIVRFQFDVVKITQYFAGDSMTSTISDIDYPNWGRAEIDRIAIRNGVGFTFGYAVPFVGDYPEFSRQSARIPTEFQTILRRIRDSIQGLARYPNWNRGGNRTQFRNIAKYSPGSRPSQGLGRFPNWDRMKIERNFRRNGVGLLPVLGLFSVLFVYDYPNFVRQSEQVLTQFGVVLKDWNTTPIGTVRIGRNFRIALDFFPGSMDSFASFR